MYEIGLSGLIGLIFLLPGFISYKIYMQLRMEKKIDVWEKIMNVLIFSITTYLLIVCILKCIYKDRLMVVSTLSGIIDVFFRLTVLKTLLLTLGTLIICVFIAVIAAIMYRTRVINHIGYKMNLSDVIDNDPVLINIANDDDINICNQIWNLNLPDKVVTGEIKRYGLDDEKAEFFLENVSVLNKVNGGISHCEHFYVARPISDLEMFK